MNKRIGSIIIAVLLVLSMSVNVMAAGTNATPNLDVDMNRLSNWVFFNADFEGVEATNGRICINYDADLLTYIGYETEGRWVTSVNADTEGEVWFAWAGREYGYGDHTLKLTFQLNGAVNAELVITSEMTELYNDGEKLESTEEYLIDEASLNVSYDGSTQVPGGEIPLPQPPVEEDGTGGNTPDTDDHPFVDIDDHWAEDDIIKAWKAGLVNGTSDTTFSPNSAVTRGMFVTLLYRLSGSPAVSGDTPFTDVADGKYYADPVLWAYKNSVVNGTSDTTFSPDKLVTRQEMVTMLFRYAKLTGVDVSASAALSDYSDANEVASWALEAMEWAVAEGIINGYAGELNPLNNTKRAEAATILVRFAGL